MFFYQEIRKYKCHLIIVFSFFSQIKILIGTTALNEACTDFQQWRHYFTFVFKLLWAQEDAGELKIHNSLQITVPI